MILDFTQIKENGEYTFQSTGAKNTILPMLFLASGLSIKFKKNIILNNVPELKDVEICIKYLISLGVKLSNNKGRITILGDSILKNEIDYELYSNFRYSILTFGLLLNFFDSISIPDKTGGCSLGERKNDLHYDFFEKVGFSVVESELGIYVEKKVLTQNINELIFSPHIASTTLTENIIIYCSLCINKSIQINIDNFYGVRPDISELLNILKIFGFNFKYKGKKLTNINYVVKKLPTSIEYNILSDFDQALFYIFLGIVTKSNIKYLNYYNDYNYKEVDFLNKYFGVIVTNKNNTLFIEGRKFKSINYDIEIVVDEYPNIMSDSQPLISLLGLSLDSLKISDERFINRYDYSIYYDLFGCKNIVGGNSITVFKNNKNNFYKEIDENITLYSIRESGLLLLLSIYFKSKITIDNTYILERGYENIFKNLKLIGAYVEENK